MTVRILFDPIALAHIDELDTWWRHHRRVAAGQVTEEVQRICAVLEESPNTGKPYPTATLGGVRSMRLKKTPYRLYYKYVEDADELVIVAVWSSMRRFGPSI